MKGQMTGKKETRVAIPSMWPGGLNAACSGHFGRCDCFTLVDLDSECIIDIRVVPNPPHEQGGCLEPVDLLKKYNTEAVIVQGIGLGPLHGFRQAGIQVYVGQAKGVQEIVRAFLADQFPVMDEPFVCRG